MPPKQVQAPKAKKTAAPTAPSSKVTKNRASQKATSKKQTANSVPPQIPLGANPYRFITTHEKPIYFNSHSQGQWACFSNLFTVEGAITISGITMPTAEHHVQYSKAYMFNDQQTAESIKLASTPKEAQELGKRVKNVNQEQWDKEKATITHKIVYLKFKNNSELRSILLGTGDVPIVQASLDREWGIGYYKKDAEANRMYWGENLQGLCLMASRVEIIQFEAEEKEAQNDQGSAQRLEHIVAVKKEIHDEMSAQWRAVPGYQSEHGESNPMVIDDESHAFNEMIDQSQFEGDGQKSSEQDGQNGLGQDDQKVMKDDGKKSSGQDGQKGLREGDG